MRHLFFSYFMAFVTFAPTLGVAQDWPDWVQTVDLPSQDVDDSDFIDYGVYDMLYDVQVRLRPSGYDRFSRRVVKVMSRVGLEGVGAARFDFDPASENLVQYDVWRERGGVRTQLTNLEYIDVRRENEMDYGILDGRLTRYADINDVRVGDTLDISWIVEVTPTVFPEHFLYWRTEKPFSGFQIDRFRLLVDAGRDIAITGPAQPAVSTINGMTDYVWLHQNDPAVDFDNQQQSWETFYGETQITTASDWSAIVEHLVDAYAVQPIPAELAEILDDIDGTQTERATAAFRLVQERIRYMGIEIGAGGYIPRPPQTVWSRRFGDCKDKALLLVSMLAHMGIASEVVLVNLYDGELLADYLPSPYIFNHAIVRVNAADEPYFLDPTDLLQGGMGSAVRTADFHWALPIKPGGNQLVAVAGNDMIAPDYEVLASYNFETDGDLAAELSVETTYRYANADDWRRRLSRFGTERRAEQLFDWYDDRYPGAQILTPLSFTDDLDANVIVIHENYGLTQEGLAAYWQKFWVNPYAVAGELEDLPEDALQDAFDIDPVFRRHRIELTGIPGLQVPSETLMQTPFFRYTRDGFQAEDGIAVEFVVKTLVSQIQPVDADAYTQAVEDMDQKDDYWFNLGFSKRTLAQPLMFGLNVQSTISILGFVLILAFAVLTARQGYVLERNNWTKKNLDV